MTPEEIILDKSLKAKQKTEHLAAMLLNQSLTTKEWIALASAAKDSPKATCIEALEFATRQDPGVADESCLAFLTESLQSDAPRVKWESAKVIGNIAAQFPKKLHKAISHLLTHAESEGTVVRWASAFALGEIIQLNGKLFQDLVPVVENLCNNESDPAIKKKYQAALNKYKKKK